MTPAISFGLGLLLLGLLVVLGIAGAAVAAGGNRRHKRNVQKSRQLLAQLRGFQGEHREARILTYLRKIDPFLFEETLLSAFEDCGNQVKRNRRYTGDGGIDGRVMIDGRLVPIQAKRYASAINPEHVREFAKIAQAAGMGLFIHTGRTGDQSWRARNGVVWILSGRRLIELIDGRDPLQTLPNFPAQKQGLLPAAKEAAC